MRYCPEKASGSWPCYEITPAELGAICEASGGSAVDQDDNPLLPAAEAEAIAVIDGMLATLATTEAE